MYVCHRWRSQLPEGYKEPRKKSKKKKNAVKRPLTQYQLFVKENYHKVKAETGAETFTEVSKQISLKWKEHKAANNL